MLFDHFSLNYLNQYVYLKEKLSILQVDMYKRELEESILKQLTFFPVIVILGPRQCGKTTLAKQIMTHFEGSLYLDMESPSDLRKLDDPELYLESHKGKLIVIDEIQHKTDLFPVLRSFVDKTDRKSPIIVLGSSSQALIRQGGESLAGRIALIELSPLTIMEVDDKSIQYHWVRGGFPDSISAPDDELSNQWRSYFIKTLVERDLPQLGLRLPASSLHRLMLLLAHNHGTLLNLSKTGELFGVSHTQMRTYLDFLQGAFLIRSLPPFDSNVKSQLVKTPKIYFRDCGLLHSIMSISSLDNLLGHTVCGESWEGFVIEQIISSISSSWRASFYRTRSGAEIDLILEKGPVRFAIECKMHTAPTVSKGFWNCIEELAIPHEHCWIVCPINETIPYKKGITIGGVHQVIEFIRKQ
jgi:predicted AAA+ superfamily ATPase